MEGRQCVWGSTACGHSSSLGPLPRSSPVHTAWRHTLGSPMGEEPPVYREKTNSGQEDAPWKTRLSQQSRPPEPSGRVLGLQRLKLAHCVYFCWLPRCIITCQHIRCGLICVLKIASATGADGSGKLENMPPAQKQLSKYFTLLINYI